MSVHVGPASFPSGQPPSFTRSQYFYSGTFFREMCVVFGFTVGVGVTLARHFALSGTCPSEATQSLMLCWDVLMVTLAASFSVAASVRGAAGGGSAPAPHGRRLPPPAEPVPPPPKFTARQRQPSLRSPLQDLYANVSAFEPQHTPATRPQPLPIVGFSGAQHSTTSGGSGESPSVSAATEFEWEQSELSQGSDPRRAGKVRSLLGQSRSGAEADRGSSHTSGRSARTLPAEPQPAGSRQRQQGTLRPSTADAAVTTGDLKNQIEGLQRRLEEMHREHQSDLKLERDRAAAAVATESRRLRARNLTSLTASESSGRQTNTSQGREVSPVGQPSSGTHYSTSDAFLMASSGSMQDWPTSAITNASQFFNFGTPVGPCRNSTWTGPALGSPLAVPRHQSCLTTTLQRCSGTGPGPSELAAALLPHLTVGGTIKGWTLGLPLGTGTTAGSVVYVALDHSTGRFLAGKHQDIPAGEDVRTSSITREAEILQGLSHPGIACMQGFHVMYSQTVKGGIAIILFMELGDVGTLRHALDDFGAMPPITSRIYTVQLTSALSYLHEKTIVHRDIKAENVVLTSRGECKLCDFGEAIRLNKENSESSESSRLYPAHSVNMHGSALWMAPEVLAGGGHSLVSDVWSLGATVLEIMTGQPPFAHLAKGKKAGGVMSVMFALANNQETPAVPEHLPADARDFLTGVFVIEPEQRKSAEDLLAHEWLAGVKGPVELPPQRSANPHIPLGREERQRSLMRVGSRPGGAFLGRQGLRTARSFQKPRPADPSQRREQGEADRREQAQQQQRQTSVDTLEDSTGGRQDSAITLSTRAGSCIIEVGEMTLPVALRLLAQLRQVRSLRAYLAEGMAGTISGSSCTRSSASGSIGTRDTSPLHSPSARQRRQDAMWSSHLNSQACTGPFQ